MEERERGLGNGYKLSVIRWIRSEDLLWIVVTIVDKTIVSLKFAKTVGHKHS